MAYLSNPLDDQQQKQQQAATPSTSGVIGGSTGGVGAGGPTSAAANGADQRTPGTGFVNLQSYLNANQGEGARLASQANSGLVNDANSFKSTAAKTASDTAAALQGQTGDDKVGQLKSGIVADASGTQKAASDFISGAGIDTTAANNAKATLQSQQKGLDDRLAHVDDSGTQIDALNQTYGKSGNPYTTGFSTLDQFLVNGSDDGRKTLANIKGTAADVDAATAGAAGQLNSAAQAAQAKLIANQKAVKDAAAQAERDRLAASQGKVAAMNAGLDPNKFDGVAQASLGDVLSDKDRADLEALAAISGGDKSADWYAKTFNQGTAKPLPPPPPADLSAIDGTIQGAGNTIGTIQSGASPTAGPNQQLAALKAAYPELKKDAGSIAAAPIKLAPTLATRPLDTLPLPPEAKPAVKAADTVVNNIVNAANDIKPTISVPAIKKPKMKWH